MEHYRSTLGTAAAAVINLYVAARVLHPGNFEEQPRPERPAAAQIVAGAAASPASDPAWVDPPFDLSLRPSATAAEMAVLAPRMTAPLPAGVTMAPALPAEMAAAPDRPRKAAAGRRQKAAQRAARARQAAPVRDRTATAAPTAARPASADPLDVSLRDLDAAGGRQG